MKLDEMLKAQMCFFGEGGLTMSSANHTADMAKEKYSAIETELANTRFIDKTVTLLSSGVSGVVSSGLTTTEGIKDKLDSVSKLHSLCAWLREAIKEEERLFTAARQWTDLDAKWKLGDEPMRPNLAVTDEEVINSWTVAEKFRYLNLEAECAVLGKYIHENGVYNRARKRAVELTEQDTELIGEGANITLFKYTPSLPLSEVDETFFTLQDYWRGKQAELNGIKNSIKLAKEKIVNERESAYNVARSKWYADFAKITEGERNVREELVKLVSALKIVIPKSLREVYEMVK